MPTHSKLQKKSSATSRTNRGGLVNPRYSPHVFGPAQLQKRLGNKGMQMWFAEQLSPNSIQANTNFSNSSNSLAQSQRKSNKLPEQLQSGVEQLSGIDLSKVQVNYNSTKPAQLDALAYTQGQNIHLAPGQEKYLPHESWHVVQQMQGRVKPTMQAKNVPINDNNELEREADTMGKRALHPVSSTGQYHDVQNVSISNGFVTQRASPLSDAIRVLKGGSNTTGVKMLTENLVRGIRQAENMFLKDRPFNRLGESLGASDTVGPGQLGGPAIAEVDKKFASAATTLAAIHGAAPLDWKSKATDEKWSYFYIAAYLAHCIDQAEKIFHPATPVLSNTDLGILQLGIAIYHGAFSTIRAMRRRIAAEKGIGNSDVTWAMVNQEARSGTATHSEMELEQYTQAVLGSWKFEFDITARLPKTRRFQIPDGKLEVTVMANYNSSTTTSKRGSKFRILLRRYVMATGPMGATAEGFENHGSINYNIGSREMGTWTGLPKGDYYLVIEKVEANFSPDRLTGKGIVKTIF